MCWHLSYAILLLALTNAAHRVTVPNESMEGVDSDGDGIADHLEQNGVPGEPLLDFPTYGADHSVPDIFVQADWVTCDPIVEYCGPNNSLNRNQVSSAGAQALAAYFAPDVAVHVDNGVMPPRPELASVHGAWGGAKRLPPGPQPCNAGSLGVRYGYFHRGTFAGLGGGGGGDLYGFCFGGDSVRMSVAAHELGHNFGLGHGGNDPSYPANCKPQYRSIMNYTYLYDPAVTQFSRGKLGIVLRPEAMNEELGLGTTDPLILDTLRSSPWSLSVRDDGAVDWNRDGRFDTQPVRAAPTWAYSSCEQSTAHSNFFMTAAEPSMIWLPVPGAPRLYLFTRRSADQVPGYRVATRFDRCDMHNEPESCTDFTPPGDQAEIAVPGALSGQHGIALAAWDVAGGARLMAVYADETGMLHAQTMTIEDASPEAGEETWDRPVPLPNGYTDGSPAIALVPGANGQPNGQEDSLIVLAPNRGQLLRWERPLGEGEFSGPAAEVWEDGTAMEPCYGPALTAGFERGQEKAIYAALPAGDYCALEFARRNADGTWARLTDTIWPGTVPLTGASPGLAYVPFDPAVPEEGRFYLAWRPYPIGPTLITHSIGNDPDPEAQDRQLRFLSGLYLRNVWAIISDGITLGFNPRFDTNLRAAWATLRGVIQFHPFADGIIDVEMRDQDDYEYILANLACSLTASCNP